MAVTRVGVDDAVIDEGVEVNCVPIDAPEALTPLDGKITEAPSPTIKALIVIVSPAVAPISSK